MRLTINLPVKDNDGRPFPLELTDSWRREAAAIVGGFTSYIAEGRWFDAEGEEYTEPMEVLEIYVLEYWDGEKVLKAKRALEALAHRVRVEARQIAVFFSIDGRGYLSE